VNSAWSQHPIALAQEAGRVGQGLDHVERDDPVDALVLERQRLVQVGDPGPDPLVVQQGVGQARGLVQRVDEGRRRVMGEQLAHRAPVATAQVGHDQAVGADVGERGETRVPTHAANPSAAACRGAERRNRLLDIRKGPPKY
jgi:hypothetical protein